MRGSERDEGSEVTRERRGRRKWQRREERQRSRKGRYRESVGLREKMGSRKDM